MALITKLMMKTTIYLDHIVLRNLRPNQTKIYERTNFNTSKLVVAISYVHTNASLLAIGTMLAQNPIGKYD
jgi:hypothetical protein